MNSEGAGGYGNRSCIAAVGDRERGSIYSAHLQCVDRSRATGEKRGENLIIWPGSIDRIDPKRLGARIGITSVLHTWGSALVHHPHIHMIVPGGGISLDGQRWVSCRPRYLLPVPVLSELFRGLILHKLLTAHTAGKLQFFGKHAALAQRKAFAAYLAPLRKLKWHVYTKRPFGGPKRCSLIYRATPTASPSPIAG